MDDSEHDVLAYMTRVNKFRAVWVKSAVAQRDPVDRAGAATPQSLDTRNTIWSIPQDEGLKPAKLSDPDFVVLVSETLDDSDLGPLVRPLAAVAQQLN